MFHEGFRVPDRVFWALVVLINLLTWGAVIYFYPSLPSPLPTHFGLSGQPDAYAAKTFWAVFLPVMIQTAETLLMIWIYRHPQYSNLPSSMALSLFPEPWRSRLIAVLRHMLVMVTVITNLIFAYISLAIISVSLGLSTHLSGWAVAGLVGFLLVLIIVYTVWLFRLSKEALAAAKALPR